MILAIILAASLAVPPDLPPGITCEMVREKVHKHGYLKSLAWAIKEGYSAYQIQQAKRCLK